MSSELVSPRMTDRNGQPEPITAADNGRVVIASWPRMLTVELLATYIGLAAQTVRNNADRIPGRRNLGRRVLFDRHVIDRWLDRCDGARDLWVDARAMTK